MDVRRRMLSRKKTTSSGGGSTTGGSYTVNLNDQWEATTAVPNPDSTLYDGVYRSSSNYNVNSGVATMYITIKDCSSFKMYIRSYAESNFDYVMVSQLDQTITGSSSYSNTTLVKAHTRGNQQSGTALSSYTLVEFTGITSGEHTITVVYRKDGSVNDGDDRGYVLIEKVQAGSGDSGSGGDDVIPEPIINIDNYLTIEALEDGLTAKLSTNTCEYCVDGDGNWKTLSAGTATASINSGHTLSFRGNLTPATDKGIGTFTISKKCNLKGNCMSMLFGDNAANNYSLSGKNYAFYNLFYNCKNLIEVSTTLLPATILSNYCYKYMFDACSNLRNAPNLPAIDVLTDSYRGMFYECSSLTTPPVIEGLNYGQSSCLGMFNLCSSLVTAPSMNPKTVSLYCFQGMFENCINLTSFEVGLNTLSTAYTRRLMFNGCSKLNYIKFLTVNQDSHISTDWVKGVSSNGLFIKHPYANFNVGTSGIPSGWTIQDADIDTSGYICFHIGNNTYMCPENMTFGEFIKSEWLGNCPLFDNGAIEDDENVITDAGYPLCKTDIDGNQINNVYYGDIIEHNATYTGVIPEGGGGAAQ